MRAARVEIAVVSKAHGVRGEIVAIPHDPESSSLAEVSAVWIGGVRREVVRARPVPPGAYLLALEGITDRDAAAALRGALIEADREELDLDEDEVLLADLIGCRCVLPYGGGPGMVMKCEPLVAAIEAACAGAPPDGPRPHRVLLSPCGAQIGRAHV